MRKDTAVEQLLDHDPSTPAEALQAAAEAVIEEASDKWLERTYIDESIYPFLDQDKVLNILGTLAAQHQEKQ